ncbi:MAG TPA: BamA/TamA family outer membrane protein, partial [Longimicrobiales bacterium]|nr:BamA/TamA family outer membrane protein [Longimicrobiales bacterium]
PTGGHAVLEASAEGRWWLGESLQVAAFLDYGAIRRDALVIDGTTAIEERWWHAVSPGVGIRVLTGLGPIRLDVGLDTDGVTGAPLFAETDDDLMFLGPVRYDPYTEGDAGGFTRFVRRLQVHVGIGQPF